MCGGDLTASYGNINSPGYPGNYPPGRDCYWTVSVDPGLLITFAFGTLSIEQHPDCNYDFLEVQTASKTHHIYLWYSRASQQVKKANLVQFLNQSTKIT